MKFTNIIMEHPDLWVLLTAILGWLSARWALRIAERLPVWLDKDWTNQAQEHLGFENPEPAPAFKWWTLKHLYTFELTSKYEWLPVVGPVLNKNYSAAIIELIGLTIGLRLSVIDPLIMFMVLIFTTLCLALAIIDRKTMFLPDMLVYPLLWVGLTKSIVLNNETQMLTGAMSGFMFFYILQKGYSLIRKREGMGGGDVKLIAALGAWVGLDYIVQVIIVSAVIAILDAIRIKIFTKHKDAQFPFGPALIISGMLCTIGIIV